MTLLAAALPISAAFAQQPPVESINDLLAHADVAAGQATAKPCMSCHNFEKGGPNKFGPNLWDIVNRQRASHTGFTYSGALLSGKGKPWTYDELNHWLYGPSAYVPGTYMTFVGLKKTQDRANVIAWLRTLSDHQAPLPTPK